MEQLKNLLVKYRVIAIDTSLFIYYIEEDERYINAADTLFNLIAEGSLNAVTSLITLIEVLVQPIKHGNKDLEEKYRKLLLYSNNLEIENMNLDIAERTAELRAKYNIRVPDAIQLATALVRRAEVFITNDVRLGNIFQEIPIIVLDNYI
ncbi:MAG: PIN domain-containing protein [Candidatus Schekmanbacteria bacterium]|nr:PIN domain-containing protein [Candidatus Schekmanbacteria bacterium]